MTKNFERRVAALRARARLVPDAAEHNPDPEYAKALLNATGLTREDVSAKLKFSTATLRNYTSGRTAMSYSDQYAIESLVATTKEGDSK